MGEDNTRHTGPGPPPDSSSFFPFNFYSPFLLSTVPLLISIIVMRLQAQVGLALMLSTFYFLNDELKIQIFEKPKDLEFYSQRIPELPRTPCLPGNPQPGDASAAMDRIVSPQTPVAKP